MSRIEEYQAGSFIGKHSVVKLIPYLVELMRFAVAIISSTSSRRRGHQKGQAKIENPNIKITFFAFDYHNGNKLIPWSLTGKY